MTAVTGSYQLGASPTIITISNVIFYASANNGALDINFSNTSTVFDLYGAQFFDSGTSALNPGTYPGGLGREHEQPGHRRRLGQRRHRFACA